MAPPRSSIVPARAAPHVTPPRARAGLSTRTSRPCGQSPFPVSQLGPRAAGSPGAVAPTNLHAGGGAGGHAGVGSNRGHRTTHSERPCARAPGGPRCTCRGGLTARIKAAACTRQLVGLHAPRTAQSGLPQHGWRRPRCAASAGASALLRAVSIRGNSSRCSCAAAHRRSQLSCHVSACRHAGRPAGQRARGRAGTRVVRRPGGTRHARSLRPAVRLGSWGLIAPCVRRGTGVGAGDAGTGELTACVRLLVIWSIALPGTPAARRVCWQGGGRQPPPRPPRPCAQLQATSRPRGAPCAGAVASCPLRLWRARARGRWRAPAEGARGRGRGAVAPGGGAGAGGAVPEGAPHPQAPWLPSPSPPSCSDAGACALVGAPARQQLVQHKAIKPLMSLRAGGAGCTCEQGSLHHHARYDRTTGRPSHRLSGGSPHSRPCWRQSARGTSGRSPQCGQSGRWGGCRGSRQVGGGV